MAPAFSPGLSAWWQAPTPAAGEPPADRSCIRRPSVPSSPPKRSLDARTPAVEHHGTDEPREGNYMRRFMPLAALVLLPLLLPAGQLAAHATTELEGVPSFGHVFVIVGENTDLSQLNKNSAPYQTKVIK